jgi:hypothetical protein
MCLSHATHALVLAFQCCGRSARVAAQALNKHSTCGTFCGRSDLVWPLKQARHGRCCCTCYIPHRPKPISAVLPGEALCTCDHDRPRMHEATGPLGSIIRRRREAHPAAEAHPADRCVWRPGNLKQTSGKHCSLLERDEARGSRRADAGAPMPDGLVRDRELPEVAGHHLRLHHKNDIPSAASGRAQRASVHRIADMGQQLALCAISVGARAPATNISQPRTSSVHRQH